ncbi:hypothetical protein F0U60_38620 [Archangium minus]|uniref:Uncharacterized protein n=1 Tax=Archangium minus TaxID=83450 RepID=A0ABY9X1W1_9BACT|nr:hypothetical protein F0U60_38620 [Archangium minus]
MSTREPRARTHLLAWGIIWAVWAFISRNNQASLPLLVIATTLLVGCSALAVYANHGLWIPRLLRRGRPLLYAAVLGATLLVLTFLVVLGIQAAYDILWEPDPLRFGFWTNVAMDFLFISFHVLAAAGVLAAMKVPSS